MEFTFTAERKVVFTVQAGGVRRLVEFSERNENGVSRYFTSNPKVAEAIRKSSLSRRGIIIETTPREEIEKAIEAAKPQQTILSRTLSTVKGVGMPKPKLTQKPLGTSTAARKAVANIVRKAVKEAAAEDLSGDVREYDNFSVAREKISKEFSIPKKDVRTPTALAKAAKEHGFTIKYKNAEQ